jgi:predicted amidophosphoribosyltransferase
MEYGLPPECFQLPIFKTMKKKECPSCAMEIDAKSKACPICGYEFPSRNASLKVVALILALLFLYLIFR